MTKRCMIVAVSDDMAIGVNGGLPWHISEDLKYFKKTTLGHPVIMGRTTFQSIGRPLPGRENIVLTHHTRIDSVRCAASLQEAFGMCEDAQKCFVIGGASVYKAAIDMVDELYVTRVHTLVEDADAFFPQIDPAKWERVEQTATFEEGGLTFEFEVYSRKK